MVVPGSSEVDVVPPGPGRHCPGAMNHSRASTSATECGKDEMIAVGDAAQRRRKKGRIVIYRCRRSGQILIKDKQGVCESRSPGPAD